MHQLYINVYWVQSSPCNNIGGVMVCMLTWSEVDCGFEPDRVTLMTMKLVFVASLLSMQH